VVTPFQPIPVGTVGACVSGAGVGVGEGVGVGVGHAVVLIERLARPEVFPAASKASTANVEDVPHVRPEIV
jgi:hypothetical protein